MIDINLVPENMRKNRRSKAVAATSPSSAVVTGLPQTVVFGILGAFTALLILVLLGCQGYLALQISKRNNLKKQLADIEQARKNVEVTIKEIKDLNVRVKTLEKVVGGRTILWAEKLNEISDNLPRGVWLTKVALEAQFLVLEGSAVSKMKTEIADIHLLTGKLKSDKNFMVNLKSLELDMIKARNVDNLSVADFKIKAELEK
ncbi:MAG: PilN domain-containing protein [Candidatus Omnitrophica bacterium]|nr:PilN domain-containing protein [Candidatus Omnitrophota bacterium]